jgi:hypothetical protein
MRTRTIIAATATLASLWVPNALSASPIIKLNCDVKSRYTHTSGKFEDKTGIATLEIEQISDHVWITMYSDIDVLSEILITSRSLQRGGLISESQNSSTSYKWDIVQETLNTGNQHTNRQKLYLDRTSGRMIYNAIFKTPQGAYLTTDASGTCRKATEQKLF